MKNYLILTRLMLLNTLSAMNPFRARPGQKASKRVFQGILITAVMLMAVGSVVYLEYELHKALASVGQRILLPGLALLAAMASTLLIGLMQGITELYQGKDAPWLAVLPATSRQVFAARLTGLYLSEQALNALLVIPAFVLYTIGAGSPMPYVITGLLVFLLVPLIPLGIITLLSSLLMRIGAFARHREQVTMALSILLAIGYSVCVTLLNARQETNTPASIVMLLLRENGLLNLIVQRFPPARWATEGFVGSWGQLGLLAAVSILCIVGVILLVGPGYLEHSLSLTEHTAVRKVRSGPVSWQDSSQLATLARLEWRELLRTPVWAVNGLLGVLMFPLMISVGFIAGSASEGFENVVVMMNAGLNSLDAGFSVLICAAVLCMGSMVNPAVATAITREGGRYPFAMTLPVRQKTRYMAKLLVGFGINVFTTVGIAAVMMLLGRISPAYVLGGMALSLLLGLAAACATLSIDAARPVLNWMNETQAIKNNISVFFGMLLWLAMVGLCVVPAILLRHLGGTPVLLIVSGIVLLEIGLSWLMLMRQARRQSWLPESV